MTRARFSPAASRLCSGARPSASRLSRDATFPPISAILRAFPPLRPPLHLSRLSPLPFPPQETSERVQQRRSSQERVQDPQARLGRARPTRELFRGRAPPSTAPATRHRVSLLGGPDAADDADANPKTPGQTRPSAPRVSHRRAGMRTRKGTGRSRRRANVQPRARARGAPSTMSAARMRRAARMAQSAPPPPPPLWARATARPASRVVPRVRAVPWTARHPAGSGAKAGTDAARAVGEPESTPRRISASSRRTRTRTPGRTTARSRSTSTPTRTA